MVLPVFAEHLLKRSAMQIELDDVSRLQAVDGREIKNSS